jgi:hypothetical protein
MGKRKWNKKQWNLLQDRRVKKKKISYVRQNTTEEGRSLSRVIIYRAEKKMI